MDRNSPSALVTTDFPQRLKQLIGEYGSRSRLSKATGIPGSTLQSYEAGSKPGLDALATLARVANADLGWLVSGKGAIRPRGLVPGALLADVVMVDQYEIGTALSMEIVIGSFPFSRHLLESRLRLKEPSNKTLLVVEADCELSEIAKGDLVLVDRDQKHLGRDGVYLLDLPGTVLRSITRCVGGKVRVMAPAVETDELPRGPRRRRPMPSSIEELNPSELLGADRFAVSKVVGRTVWIGRKI